MIRVEMHERIWFLKNCDLLGYLNSEEISNLEKCCQRKVFPAAHPIYLPAEAADSIFIVATGLVKICHLAPEGKVSTIGYVKPGEVFGELALFDVIERGEYVESVLQTAIIRIPKQRIQDLMNRNLDVALGITKMVGLRRQRIERRLRNLLFTPNDHRLIHLLLDLAEQFGESVEGGIRLGLRLSHQEIANLIGTTRETVTILMGRMKTEGLVGGQRQTVVLRDVARLSAMVGRVCS